MNPYTSFAELYDSFMQDAPHEAWHDYLVGLFPNLDEMDFADLGCGTGRLTTMLATTCRTVVGIDISEEMLAKASERTGGNRASVRFLCQDMRTFRLPSKVNAVVSSCDCVNYLPTADDLLCCFDRVSENLHPAGWFCFDILGPRRLNLLREGIWYHLQPDAAMLFETSVVDDKYIEYDVHMFHSEDGVHYRRSEERHQQTYYPLADVVAHLKTSGFQVRDVFGDFGASDVAQADRVCVIAQKIEPFGAPTKEEPMVD